MDSKPKKVKRAVTLSEKANDDLILLTDALGVNVHSYLSNEVAKIIQRDSLSLKIKNDTQNQMSGMMEMVAAMMESKE